MPSRRKRSLQRRLFLVGIFSVALCAILIVEVWEAGGGVIRLPLRMAPETGFPVALLSWLGVAAYAWGYSRLFQLTPSKLWARAIPMGFGLHLLVLLAHLMATVVHEPPTHLSIWYLRYLDALWVTTLAAGFIVAWRMAARCRAGSLEPILFFLPLFIGYAGFWVESMVLAPRLTIAASIIGLSVLAASRFSLGQVAGTRLVAFVKHEQGFLTIIFFIALGLRLFYTTRVMSNPNYWETGSDGPAYDALATALLRHEEDARWSGMPLFAPGYVRFLALMYWLLGRNYFLVCAVQSVIGAWACLLLYAIAKRLFGLPTARLAAMFGAVNFSMVFAAAAIGHQALDVFWTLAVVWCLVRYTEDPTRWGRRMIPVGMLLGWAAVTREGNIAFWLLLLGWFLIGVRAKLGWRKAVSHVLALSVGFAIVLAPFVAGKGGGIHSRLGTQWFILQHAGFDLNAWFNPWREPLVAWERLREQPFEVIQRVGSEILHGFNAIFFYQEYGFFDPVALIRDSAYSYGIWWYAYLLGFWGLWLVLRSALRTPAQRLGWWLVLVVLVSRALPHLLLEGSFRHRVPMEPYLILLAAYGAVSVWQRAKFHPADLKFH